MSRGRESAMQLGVGSAAARSGRGQTVAALAVCNAFGDVFGEEGGPIGCARGEAGEPLLARDVLAGAEGPPEWASLLDRNTTLVCVMTDAALDKVTCTRS